MCVGDTPRRAEGSLQPRQVDPPAALARAAMALYVRLTWFDDAKFVGHQKAGNNGNAHRQEQEPSSVGGQAAYLSLQRLYSSLHRRAVEGRISSALRIARC